MRIASVGIYFDKKKNVLIIPGWKDNIGIGRQSMKYSILEHGFAEQLLGKEIMKALDISKLNEQEDPNQKVFLVAGNVKSWKAFQKKYEYVDVVIDGKMNWWISKEKKCKDGSYGLQKDELAKYQRKFTEPLSAEQLGKTVLDMLALK